MDQAKDQAKKKRQVLIGCLIAFLVSSAFFFMGQRRYPNAYDEGLLLTAAMRITAGQVPHRDFYAIYGPADFYIPALLFKLFGQNLLVDRLLDIVVQGLTVALTFAVAAKYCRISLAAVTAILIALWLDGLNAFICSAVFPVALLNLASSALLFPLFSRQISKKRLVAAGILAGASALYRYDTGAALLVTQACTILAAVCIRKDIACRRLREASSALWPYLAGFAIITAPAVTYFLHISTLYPLLLDVVILQAKNYKSGRSMPFPGLHFKILEQPVVYLPVLVIALTTFSLWYVWCRSRTPKESGSAERDGDRGWSGVLITLSLLSFVMFFKGWVRVGPLPMFPSILPSIIITAVLCERKRFLPLSVQRLAQGLFVLFFMTGMFAFAKTIRHLLIEGSIPGSMVARLTGSNGRAEGDWCKKSNPLTKGVCFSTDAGRRKTIEFIDTHTRPGQTLYVGLPRHDKTFANDNLLYFATQRMPATAWSHFDPGLQNSYATQTLMVQDLERSSPPYIVMDSEFEANDEPNESSKSSGVYLLDDFIRQKYRFVTAYDEMSIWQAVGSVAK